jgi:fibronectin type 3 domain-containing protein
MRPMFAAFASFLVSMLLAVSAEAQVRADGFDDGIPGRWWMSETANEAVSVIERSNRLEFVTTSAPALEDCSFAGYIARGWQVAANGAIRVSADFRQSPSGTSEQPESVAGLFLQMTDVDAVPSIGGIRPGLAVLLGEARQPLPGLPRIRTLEIRRYDTQGNSEVLLSAFAYLSNPTVFLASDSEVPLGIVVPIQGTLYLSYSPDNDRARLSFSGFEDVAAITIENARSGTLSPIQFAVGGYARKPAASGGADMRWDAWTLWLGNLEEAPQDLEASRGTFDDKIRLSWQPASGSLGYRIYRQGIDQPIGQCETCSQFEDYSVPSGVEYGYVVENTTGSGHPMRATAIGWRNLPPPGGLHASDGTFPAHVALTWDQVPDAIGYSVFRAIGSGAATRIAEIDGGITSHEDGTATPGTVYRYTVRSICVLGESAASLPDEGWRPATPVPVVNASDGSDPACVVVGWAPRAGALGYRITRNQSPPYFYALANSQSYRDTSAVPVTSYSYSVEAFTNAGYVLLGTDQGWRSSPPPANLQASDGASTAAVNVTWSLVSGASGYQLYRASGSAALQPIGGLISTPPYLDTSAEPGVQYRYVVHAMLPLGQGAPSSQEPGWRNVPPPTGLVASQGTTSSGVELSWNQVPNASGYRILRGTGSAAPVTAVGNSVAGFFTDSSALPGIGYTYAVRALTPAGESLSGNMASGWRDVMPVGSFNASDGTSLTGVTLSWSAPAGASGYQIRRRPSPSSGWIPLGVTTSTGFSDVTGLPGVPYDYAVFVNTPSGPSSSAPAIDAGWRGVSPPTGVQASDGTLTTGVQLVWNPVPAALSYRVFRAAGAATPIFVSEVVGTSVLDEQVPAGTTFNFSVRAVLPGGLSAPSGADSGWRNLASPSDVAATDGTRSDGVQITWSPVSGALGHRIFRSTGSGVPVQVGQVGSSLGAFLDGTATAGLPYTYTVRAWTSAGVTSPSNPDAGWRNVVAPSNVAATQVLTEGVRISWTASAGAIGYTVYRGTASSDLVALAMPPASPFIDYDTVAGVPYTYQVRARTALGVSAPSSVVVGTRAIAAPLNVQASDGTSIAGVMIGWNAVPGVSTYRILRSIGTAVPSIPIGNVVGQTQFLDEGAMVGVVHNYSVQAVVGEASSTAGTPNTGWRGAERPTGVTASDGSRTDGVLVRWTRITPPNGITGYRIFRATSGAAASQVGSVSASADSYLDTGAIAGTTYLYTVTASTAAGNSSPSDSDSGWRNVAAPAAFAASDGTNFLGVQLTWQASPGAAGYRVFRRDDGGAPFELLPSPVTPGFLDVSAEPGRTYAYFAKARTASGDSVETSGLDEGFRGLAAPTSIQASDGTSSAQVTVSWMGVTGVSSYQVLRSLGTAAPSVVIATVNDALAFIDVDVVPGIVHNYSVRAVGYGRASTSAVPNSGWRNFPAPTGLVASDGLPGNAVQLTWDQVNGVVGYRIFRAAGTSAPVQIAQVSAGTTALNDASASPGIPYSYLVRGFSPAGVTSPSDMDVGWRDVTPPANLQASDGTLGTGVNLVWTASPGAIGYRIYRSENGSEPIELAPSPSGTGFLDTSSSPGVVYSYHVRARTPAGDSPRQGLPDTGYRALTAPTGIMASDGTEPGGILVQWNPIPGVSTYRVLRATGNVPPTMLRATVSQPPFLDESATIGSTFNYTIQAELNSAVSPSGVPDTGYRGILAPTGVSAGDGTLASGVRVSWNPVPGATEYRVFRSGLNQPIATVVSTSHEDTGVSVGITFSYTVRAYYAPGNLLSVPSVADSGWRNSLAPTGVSATDGSLTNGVMVSWTPVTPSNGITGYRVFRSTGSSPPVAIGTVGTNANQLLDQAAIAGTVHSYLVRTVTAAGLSVASEPDDGWRDVATPSTLTASDGASTAHVSLVWPSVAGATGFVVYRGENAIDLVELAAVPSASFEDTTATPGRKYFYQVAAQSAGGVSGRRSPANDGWRNVPPPANVRASDGSSLSAVNLAWDGVPYAIGYRVFRIAGSATPNVQIAEINDPSVLTFVDSLVVPGSTYSYAVKAKVSAPGDSGLSVPDSGHAGVAPPTNVIASDGSSTNGVSITWNGISPNTGLVGYRIYRSGTGTAIATVGVSTFAYTDTGATPGQVFVYSVKSIFAAGESPEGSSDAGWRNLPAPANVEATDGLLCGRVRITWNPVVNSAVTGYEVFRSMAGGEPVSIGIAAVSATPSADDFPPPVAPGVTTTYTVRAMMHALSTAASQENPGSPAMCLADGDPHDEHVGDLYARGGAINVTQLGERDEGRGDAVDHASDADMDPPPPVSMGDDTSDDDARSTLCEEVCKRVHEAIERLDRDPTLVTKGLLDGLVRLLETDESSGDLGTDACRMLAGDVDLDGTVAVGDLELFTYAWSVGDLIQGDLDRNGQIDVRDLDLVTRAIERLGDRSGADDE